jgi:signal transduction histidine kinase/DNA-binding response OmpR family regulator
MVNIDAPILYILSILGLAVWSRLLGCRTKQFLRINLVGKKRITNSKLKPYLRLAFLLGLISLGISPTRKTWAQPLLNALPKAGIGKPTQLRVEYIIDSTDHLAIDQLSSPQIRWQTTKNPTLVLGFLTHPVWCRFTLQSTRASPRELALELTNLYVDSLTLYQPKASGGWQTQYTGDLIPFARRYPMTRNPAFYISLSGTAPQTFYARITLNQHHNYKWQLWDKKTFDAVRLPDLERYVTLAVTLMLLLFTLALLLFMYRIAVLRAYALWGITFCLSVLFGYGNSNLYFPHSPYWAHVSYYVSVGLILAGFSYYVVQACRLPQVLPRLVWLYIGFGSIGLAYAGLSFFYRHAYLTWALIATLTILLGFTFALVVALLLSGNRPAIWNVLVILLLSPIYTYFYGRNAGFFSGFIGEELLQILTLFSIVAEPFFFVMILWQATRERIQAIEVLTVEKAQRTYIQHLDQLKTDFFTNVSHELRTPVTLLLGPLRTLHNRFPENELYAIMHRNASRLQTLINQLLDLAKLDAHQLKNSLTVGKLTDDIRGWVTQFTLLANSRSVSLTLQQSQESWYGLYDADKVEKIIVNLLSNALKFTPTGGSVALEIAYTPEGVTIAVRDTGIGVRPEEIEHLFDRFYQTREGTQLEAGTGVGLALTYELIQLLAGTITVNSQPGEGTTFTVTLPIQQQFDDQSLDKTAVNQSLTGGPVLTSPIIDSVERLDINSLADPPLAEQTRKPSLLVVEDNEDLRAYIRMTLSSQYHVTEAKDGQQGLAMAFDKLPDLIITDLMMPKLDGLDLSRALRADPRTNHIPLVMLTAKATVEDRLAGFEVGADDYLSKPFLPFELIIRLQNLLRRQAVLRDYLRRTLIGPADEPSELIQENTKEPIPQTAESTQFLDQLYTILEQNLDRTDFDAEQLAHSLALSSRTLSRKLNVVLGLSTGETMRTYRLRRGKELLKQGMPPTQVAYAVGFGSLSAFGRAYKAQYGHTPSTQQA